MTLKEQSIKDLLLSFTLSELSSSASSHAYKIMVSEEDSHRSAIISMLSAGASLSKRKMKNVPNSSEHHESENDILKLYHVFSDTDFKLRFRLNRSTIECLLSSVSGVYKEKESLYPLVPLEKKLLLTCWLLGNSSPYSDIANMLEISENDVFYIFEEICDHLNNLSEEWIKWPTKDECVRISQNFELKFGFPGTIGVIGTTYIRITKPDYNPEELFSEELKDYMVILQAVSDDNFLLRDVSMGFPGSDSDVFLSSHLYKQLEDKENPLIEPHTHILGGSDYPQLATLITPYSDENSLSDKELKFNYIHDCVCATVETAFEYLKSRFAVLERLDNVHTFQVAEKVIIAACVLHNFCLIKGDDLEPFMNTASQEEGKV